MNLLIKCLVARDHKLEDKQMVVLRPFCDNSTQNKSIFFCFHKAFGGNLVALISV